MTEKFFSRRCIVDLVPAKGYRCMICKTPLMKDFNAYKFAWVDPKTPIIKYLFTHISCADKRLENDEDTVLTEAQIRRFWTSVEELMRRKVA